MSTCQHPSEAAVWTFLEYHVLPLFALLTSFSDIKLPVATLLKQYKDNPESQLIRHFDLLYIQQGLPRVKIQERLEFLPALIQGISASVSSQKQQSSTIFFLFLQLLPHFVLPLKGSTEDLELKSRLEVSDNDTEVLAFWLGRLLLLSILSRPRNGPDQSLLPKCPGLTSEEYQFVTNYGKTGAWDASVEGGMNLTETKISAIKFLNSGIFSDYERFLPCFFASADANSRISSAAEDNLKRVLPNVDVEDKVLVEDLYLIYFGKYVFIPVRGTMCEVLTLFKKRIKRRPSPRAAATTNEDFRNPVKVTAKYRVS